MARLIRIVCILPGFRRAGIAHPHRAEYPEGFFSDAQLLQLCAEPKLSVYEVEPIPDPADARGGGGGLVSQSGQPILPPGSALNLTIGEDAARQSALTDGVAVLGADTLNEIQGGLVNRIVEPEGGGGAVAEGVGHPDGLQAEGSASPVSSPEGGASASAPETPAEGAPDAPLVSQGDAAVTAAASGGRRGRQARG